MADLNTSRDEAGASPVLPEGAEALSHVPGLDPVLAVLDGYAEQLPPSGLWVQARLEPGKGGIIDFLAYGEVFGMYPHSDDRSTSGYAAAGFSFAKCIGCMRVAIGFPAFGPGEFYTPMPQQSIVPLGRGDSLLCQPRPQDAPPYGTGFLAQYEDYAAMARRHNWARLERVTGDHSELLGIVRVLGGVAGLDASDTAILLDAVDKWAGANWPDLSSVGHDRAAARQSAAAQLVSRLVRRFTVTR